MFSNVEIKREASDVHIKEEQILDETNGSTDNLYSTSTHYDNTGYIRKANRTDLKNNSIGYMIDDLMPRVKRPRSIDTENVTTSKRMKKTEVPNFRRPWPAIRKSSDNYPPTHEENVTHSYTNFTISNIINDNNSSCQDIENDKNVQQKSSYFHDMPRIYGHNGSSGINKNIEVDSIITKGKSNYESRTIIATVSEVQNDLNITNDSDEYENEYVSGKSDNYVNTSNIKDIKQEVEAQPKQNNYNLSQTIQNTSCTVSDVQNDLNITNDFDEYENKIVSEISGKSDNYITKGDIKQVVEAQHKQSNSNLIWTIQKTNPEKLKLVISKENNNTPYSKKSQMETNYNYVDRDEQPLLVPNEQNTFECKSDRKISKSKNKTKNINIEPPITNLPNNPENSLKVSTPLRNIKKKKSKSSRRHSLPTISDMKSKINHSDINQFNKKLAQPPPISNTKSKSNQPEYNQVNEKTNSKPPSFRDIKSKVNQPVNNQVNEKKYTQNPSRVFMKKLTWENISLKEKIVTEARVKIHKMVLKQDDGVTTEIAVKAHLENLDWLSLGISPKTMVIEEGAALANLQGIKGVPYLCGVIIEDPPAIVMSYYKGRTIGDYLEEGNTLHALKTFIRTCEIVGKIHHRGWAHYDIHADNILGRVNYNNHVTVTLLNYGFCRATNVNPHYGIYSDPEDLEGHHLPVDIIKKSCNGSYVDRFSLCYILEEINDKLKEASETNAIRDAASLGLMTDQPHLRPSASHLAQLVQKLVSKHTCDTWNLNMDD